MHINPHKHTHCSQTKIIYSKTQHMFNPHFYLPHFCLIAFYSPWKAVSCMINFTLWSVWFFLLFFHAEICRWCGKTNERTTTAHPVDACLFLRMCTHESIHRNTHASVLMFVLWEDRVPIPRAVCVFACCEYVCMCLSESFFFFYGKNRLNEHL